MRRPRPVSLAPIARMGKANQIAAAIEEREDTFAISASSAICAAAGKLRQSQPKCIVLVELKEISLSTHSLSRFIRYARSLQLHAAAAPSLARPPAACIEKAYAIARRKE